MIISAAGAEMKQWYSSNDKGQMDTAAVSKQKEAALQLQLAERKSGEPGPQAASARQQPADPGPQLLRSAACQKSFMMHGRFSA